MAASEAPDMTASTRPPLTGLPGSKQLTYLETWLCGRAFGGIRVASASASPMLDEDGDSALYLQLVLNDPAADDSWPIEEVMQMHRELLIETRSLGLDEQVYLSLEPATDVPQADDDQLAYG